MSFENFKSFRVRASQHSPQLIECALPDLLLRTLSVPVVFFYAHSVDEEALLSALGRVLDDFPLFAGTVRMVNGRFCIDCNNRGVSVSVAHHNRSTEDVLTHLLDSEAESEKLVEIINAKRALSKQEPVLTIRINYFSDRGMCIGACWHHSIGDMHTFVCLMKAWSKTVAKKGYVAPLVVKNRVAYMADNVKEEGNPLVGLRYLGSVELIKLAAYMMFKAKNKVPLQFYFTQNEITNMKNEFAGQSGKRLSTNDVLCAHMFSLIASHDSQVRSRFLSIAINYRPRLGLPETLLGNMIGGINLHFKPESEPVAIASDLRRAVDHFATEHMDYFANIRYVEQMGGRKKISRFVHKALDPIKGNLLVSNWSRLGVYEVDFGGQQPVYFAQVGRVAIPWVSALIEGFANQGAILMATLPTDVAKKLVQESSLRAVHRYRDSEETLPSIAERLDWVR